MKSTIQLQQDPLSCTWESFIKTGSNAQQDELTQRLNQKQLSDLFTIIYTSGTTGEPKGVMLDYANLAHQLETHDLSLNVTDQDISLSFFYHSLIFFERAWAAYILHRGAILCYLEDTNQVRSALTEIRPTLMCAVPRFLRKKFMQPCWIKFKKHQNFAK